MSVNAEVTFCGQAVTAAQLTLIIECVARYRALSRDELASTLCEWLGWQRPNGRLKTRECRDLLHDLQARAVLDLPALRAGRPRGSTTANPHTPQGDVGEPVVCALSEVQPITLRRVEQSTEHRQWRELVGRYHYLGHATAYGACVRYLIDTSGQPSKTVGCLQFSSAAWQMKARDNWIGWDDATRQQQLPRLINNSRFLILPWVRIPNLASHVLSVALRTVTNDW